MFIYKNPSAVSSIEQSNIYSAFVKAFGKLRPL
jgi:hypothetical protein